MESTSLGHGCPAAIHRCLEQVWQRFHLRARLFLLERDALVLRDCVGAYQCCPEIGLKVHPKSVVWEIFQEGRPADLTESLSQNGRPHSLPDPVMIKAVIPLYGTDITGNRNQPLGVLVVDAGDLPGRIGDQNLQYLELMGMLISEIVQVTILMQRIQAIQEEKDRMAHEAAHIFRTSFTVIGGFARRMSKAPLNPTSKKWANIIFQEVIKGERALEAWMKSHDRNGTE